MSRTLIVALIFSFIMVAFAVQNAQVVDIDLYFWHYESSLALVVLISFGIGAIVGILFSLPGYLKRKRAFNDLKRQLEQRNKQMASQSRMTVDGDYSKKSVDNGP